MGEQGETDREGSRVVGEGSLSAQDGERENESKVKFSSNMVAGVERVVLSWWRSEQWVEVLCYNMNVKVGLEWR